MLSVLVPIYNWEVVNLIANLHKQCSLLDIKFEIICIDDCSDTNEKQKNEGISDFEFVSYLELPQNIGRSKIRNLLASKAQSKNLLFLDCDVEIADSFIANYIGLLNTNKVVCGGVGYTAQKPSSNKLLRWKYGQKQESLSLKIRSKKPYQCFKSSNFLINKELFYQIKFSEVFTSYGHEDTLFGQELEQNKIEIQHINNPIIHLGLDNAAVFINKTKQAIQNLIRHKLQYQNIKLLRFANKLEKLKLDKVFLKKYQNNKTKIHQNLLSENPKLANFALFKLGYLFELKSSNLSSIKTK